MRSRLLKNPLSCVILILFVLTPMLDSMVCADCLGNAPFQGEATIGHLQTPHGDVSYSSPDGTESNTSSAQDAKTFCSICANVLMGVEVYSSHPYTIIAHCDGPQAVLLHSELHYSINKPPQNHLV